jgi:hypothetical protein
MRDAPRWQGSPIVARFAPGSHPRYWTFGQTLAVVRSLGVDMERCAGLG